MKARTFRTLHNKPYLFVSCDEDLFVTDEFLGLVPMIDTTTANYIFNSLIGVLNRVGVDWSRADSIATDSAPSVIGKKQVLRQNLEKKYRL